MKQFIFIAILSLLGVAAMAQSPRFGTQPNQDNTGQSLTYKYLTPAYATTIIVAPNAFETFVKPAALTGDPTFTATVTSSKVCDRVYFMFTAQGAARTVTFGTNFTPSATLVVDSGQVATATFIFNGTKFIEVGRAKE